MLSVLPRAPRRPDRLRLRLKPKLRPKPKLKPKSKLRPKSKLKLKLETQQRQF